MTYIALLSLRPSLNSSIASTGHFRAHTPQPVHFSSSMYLGCLINITWKFPSSPSTLFISAPIISSMLECLPALTSFGARMHIAQSLVGKVLSSCVMVPPMLGDSSSRYTLNPESARSSDACIPAIPPPTTSTAPTLSFITLPPMRHKEDSHPRFYPMQPILSASKPLCDATPFSGLSSTV